MLPETVLIVYNKKPSVLMHSDARRTVSEIISENAVATGTPSQKDEPC